MAARVLHLGALILIVIAVSITLVTVAFNNKSKTDFPEELPEPEHVRTVIPVIENTVVEPPELELSIIVNKIDDT